MSNPSLILPQSPAYGEDYVYAAQVEDGAVPLYNVLPLTFTRASGGTRINKDGLVQNMPYNLLSDSNTFTAGWAIGIGGGSLGAFVSDPFGGTTAQVLNLNNNGILYNSSVSPYPTTISTTSIWMRTQSGSVSIQLGNPIGSPYYTKTITTTWTRFDIQVNPASFNGGIALYNSVQGSAITIEIFGAQVNIGSTAQPYLATTDRLNMPRITYPVGGGCGALLLEKQSTNLVAYSEDFTNAQYTADNATFSGNATTSPDGTIDADLLTESTSNASHGFYLPITARGTTGANLSTSVFAKQNGRRYLTLSAGFDSGNYYYAVYDLQNGVVSTSGNAGSTTLVSSTIQSFGNGWFRCVLVGSTSLPNRISFAYLADNASGLGSLGIKTYTGNGTSGVYFYGYQIEESSYATSYIPTTSTSATRIADACYKTGISNLFGTNQGTFFIDFVYFGSEQFSYLFDVTDSANANRFLMYDSNGSGLYYFYDSGYSQITTYQFTKGQRYKIAVKYNSSGTIWYVNGVLSGTGTVSFAHQMSQLYLGIRYSLTDNTNMQVNSTLIYTTALTNAELATLTTL